MFPPNTHILVVDDVMSMRKLLVKQLTGLGFTKISEAKNGEEAWKKISVGIDSKSPFELIFCDWNMPGIRGIDLLKKVRSYEKMELTPFVLVTAESEKQIILDAIEAGVSACILKPFDSGTLTEKLEMVWKAYLKKKEQAA